MTIFSTIVFSGFVFLRFVSLRSRVLYLAVPALICFSAGHVRPVLGAEICTTQSQMKPADRESIASAARDLASKVQGNDAAGLRLRTLPEYAKDFSATTSLIGNTAAKLTGSTLAVDQVYLLDASSLKTLADGTNQDAQFYCLLNKSPMEVNFLIPALPPGRYALAIVAAQGGQSPWRLSFLLKEDAVNAGQADGGQADGGRWRMAGFYPKPLTAAGHDGLWYWMQARSMVKNRQLWTGYLYYEQAQALLQPTIFTTSTHLDKLRKEETAAAPPALSDGISSDTPLVLRSAKGGELRITRLGTDDSLAADKVDVVIHVAPEPEGGEVPAADGKKASKPATAVLPAERNVGAMAALVAAYPELRASFHGVWVFSEAPGRAPFITELPMTAIP